MNKRANKLAEFKKRLVQGPQEKIIDTIMESERDLCYLIEKITHQVVDDNYPAMKMEMFKEAFEKDPNYGSKSKDDK